jgi:TRAP-type mannitol/chloroaromatic compound transport system permease small subunit
LDKFFINYNKILGNITGALMILVMFNVFIDVILRYFFNNGSLALQELEWHMFSAMFLLGIAYALNEDGHVRVDFVYDTLSTRSKAFINIYGTIFMLLPFSLFIAYGSYDFVFDSFTMNEISEDPGGLTHRWIIKAMIPFSFLLLFISGIGYINKNINIIKHNS